MTDVAIVGGGMAGAAAALWLADAGYSSVILEARDRLGGRGLSRDWKGSGSPVEYGGGWIRKDHDGLRELAQRVGMGFVPRAKIAGHTHFLNGQAQSDPSADPAHAAALDRFAGDAARSASFADLTLDAYLEHRDIIPSARREILSWWSISGSGDPGRIPVSELLTPKVGTGFRIKIEELADTVDGGVGQLVQKIAEASAAEVRLRTPVVSISSRADGVDVGLAGGESIAARSAILASPINTLSSIEFSPPLPALAEELRQSGHGGRAIKLLIRAQHIQPGMIATGETAGLRWLFADRLLPDGSTLVIGFGLADEVGTPDFTGVAAAVTAAFPGAALIDFDWHDWIADPYARGTWVSPFINSVAAYDPANWASSPNVFFAGSDHSSPEQGWFEGAVITARTAVDSAIRLLGSKESKK